MTVSRRLQLGLAVVAAGYFASFAFFPGLFLVAGVNHYGPWFLDSFALLASSDALARGLDPYAVNPLDYFHRPHVYTHWWLHLGDLGLTRADNLRVGFAFVGAFFVAAISFLRPQSWRELLWHLAFLCASPVVLAIERANNDLVVFAVLAPVVPCLLSSHRGVRLVSVLFVALAAGLKFYPAVAALVLLAGDDAREVREVRERIAVAVVALVVVGVGLSRDLAGFSAIAPRAEGLMTFSAANLFAAAGLGAPAAKVAGMILGGACAVAFARSKLFSAWEISPADRGVWLGFLLGAVLLTGCFFAGTNFGYRWIFAIWLAPLLWRLPHDLTAPLAVRRLATLTGVLLIFALWADPLVSAGLSRLRGHVAEPAIGRAADLFYRAEQPLTWALFACLIGFLVHFVSMGAALLFPHPNPSLVPARK